LNPGMRIAILQMCSGINPAANAATLVDAISAAADGGASMVFTPEMSGLLDRTRARALMSIRLEKDDPVLAAVRQSARDRNIWVNLGSLAMARESGDDLLSNRSFLIDDQGEIVGRYDKIHLFDVDLPGGETWRESAAYWAGDRAVVTPGPGDCRLGLSVCYDLRFPALYCALSAAGANLLSVPAAFTVPTGKAHWHALLRARAIENACWVVAAAQSGQHEDGRQTFGHSLVINPWGEVVLDMKEDTGMSFAEIDFEAVDTVRAQIPVLDHRRQIGTVTVGT
jgi:deaminated glutathione amidase